MFLSADQLEPARIPVEAATENSISRARFPLDLDRRLETFERDLIVQALEKTDGVQVKAAELLGITERSIWHRIKKHGITILNKREPM